ncbi:hypothetical protein ACPPVW_14040 [Leifsonia sp. McL0607]|uniref:hypothetical protein n=1 Tax=Leifsonia sp. McL0607 TaxID=3415672 RepID=UPI003CFA4481
MSALERRYRRVLRAYPSGWRSVNAEAVLGTLLERAEDEGRTRPRAGEVADLLLNGWRARIRAIATSVPVEARVAAGSAALGIAAAFSVFAIVTGELGQLTKVPPGPWPVGPLRTPAAVVFMFWVCAFLLELLRLRTAARWTLSAAIATGIVVVPIFGAAFSWRIDGMEDAISVLPSWTTFVFLTLLGAAAAMRGSGRPRRDRGAHGPFSRRAGLLGALVATVAIGFVAISVRATTTLTGFDEATLWRDDLALAVILAGHSEPQAT